MRELWDSRSVCDLKNLNACYFWIKLARDSSLPVASTLSLNLDLELQVHIFNNLAPPVLIRGRNSGHYAFRSGMN